MSDFTEGDTVHYRGQRGTVTRLQPNATMEVRLDSGATVTTVRSFCEKAVEAPPRDKAVRNRRTKGGA